MSLAIIVMRADGVVVASDDAVTDLLPGGAHRRAPERVPKLWLLLPDLVLVVCGRWGFAQLVVRGMTAVVRGCAAIGAFQQADECLATSVPRWHRDVEAFAQDPRPEADGAAVLVGIDHARKALRVVAWSSAEKGPQPNEWWGSGALCFGCTDLLRAGAQRARWEPALASAPSLASAEALAREMVAAIAAADSRVGDLVYSYRLPSPASAPLLGGPEGTLPDGARREPTAFAAVLTSLFLSLPGAESGYGCRTILGGTNA